MPYGISRVVISVMQINFKAKKWSYNLQTKDNVIGIRGGSGIGKTKLATDLYNAYIVGDIKNPVRVIKSEFEFYDAKWNAVDGYIVVVDNLENFSSTAINDLSDLIFHNSKTIWIQIGHSNWVVQHYNAIKKLNVDEKTKLITLG